MTAALALSAFTAAPAAAQTTKLKLVLNWKYQGPQGMFFVADDKGYFKQEGLDVEWRRFALGKEGRDAMIAGALDINSTAPTPFLIGLDKGIPFSELRAKEREAAGAAA